MFLVAAFVATLCAQKQGGTNELMRTTEHTEYTEKALELKKLREEIKRLQADVLHAKECAYDDEWRVYHLRQSLRLL